MVNHQMFFPEIEKEFLITGPIAIEELLLGTNQVTDRGIKTLLEGFGGSLHVVKMLNFTSNWDGMGVVDERLECFGGLVFGGKKKRIEKEVVL